LIFIWFVRAGQKSLFARTLSLLKTGVNKSKEEHGKRSAPWEILVF